jgi:hypothetical protein
MTKNTIGIWEQIEIVLNNDALNYHQKQKLINELTLLVNSKKNGNNIEVNENLMSEVITVVDTYYPDLPGIMTQKIIESKRKKLLESCLPMKNFLNVLFFILVVSLNVKENVSKTVLITHLTIYFHEISKAQKDKEHFDASKLSYILSDVVQFDLHLSQIKVKGMDVEMKAIWKCILYLIELLIEAKFLVVEQSIAYRPTDLQNTYVNSLGGRAKSNKGYSMNIISLASNVRENSDAFSSFFFSKWPQLEPTQYSDKEGSDVHVLLKKGYSRMEITEEMRNVLETAGKTKLTFNYPLFLKAIEAVTSEKRFEEYRRHTLGESIRICEEKKLMHRESRNVVMVVLRLQRIRTILDYFEKTGHSISLWIDVVKSKRRQKKSESENIYISRFEKMIIEDRSAGDAEIKNMFSYILDTYEEASDQEDFEWENYLDGFLSRENGMNIDDSFTRRIIVELFKYLGINRISNMLYISKLFPQKTVNIFKLWLERLVQRDGLSLNNLEKVNKSNKDYKDYIDSLAHFQCNLDVTFKVKLMKLFINKYSFLPIFISGNGRITYKGFAPHPHSGKFFRFNEMEKELIKDENMKHLKCAISYSFKNNLNSLTEHEKWVDENHETILNDKYGSIEKLVYIEAYQKVLLGEGTGVMIRIDQVASVLFFWGLLVDCPYYKRITNFDNNSGTIFKPYDEIAKDFLKPCLEKIHKEWSAKIKNGEPNVLKKQILLILEDILLPNIMDKKLNKALIMPHAYGMTYKGITRVILDYVDSVAPEMEAQKLEDESWLTQLSMTLHHKLNKVSPKTTILRRILVNTESIILKKMSECSEKDIFYTNVIKHKDCSIFWDYKVKTSANISVWKKDLGYSVKQFFKEMTNTPCVTQNKNTLPPLLIHSIDGAVIRKLITICDQDYGFNVITVHDCSMCHPNNVDKMLNAWKSAINYVLGEGKLTNKEFLEKIWLNPTLEYLKTLLSEEDISEIKNEWESEWLKKEKQQIIQVVRSNEVFGSLHNLSYE